MNSDMEAGPSRQPLTKQISKQPTLEFAKKVDIIPASCMENCLDYSLIVTNSVSMARDQLANERNWLTWFRLSCTLIILGFTILIKFRLPSKDDDPVEPSEQTAIGYVFVAIGFGCFFVGIGKYFKNQRLLVKQATFVEAGWGSYVIVGLLVSFACTVMILASIKSSIAE